MVENVYEVFARKERGDPLQHIGYVDASDSELARVYAWKTYDEQNWFEMCVVPRASIVPVNRTDGPFAGGRIETQDEEIPAGQPYGGDS
jgi:1,2-phenylacetyl-CoA epoxidase PaaB subunit